MKLILKCTLVLFLFFPYLTLLFYFQNIKLPNFKELLWSFNSTFYQAFLSAFFSLVFGYLFALGLNSFRNNRYYYFLEILTLAPNMLPSLFSILVVLNLFKTMPFGIVGVVITHLIINVGVVGVSLARSLMGAVSDYVLIARTMGASKYRIFFKILLPFLRNDLVSIFLFVFLACFASFSVPLIMGAGKLTTLEVLIYEKIRVSGQWGEAIIISFIQTLLLYCISFITNSAATKSLRNINHGYVIKRKYGFYLLLFFLIGYFASYIKGVFESLYPAIFDINIIQLVLGTFIIGITSGVLTWVLLNLVSYLFIENKVVHLVRGYVSPSSALVGFSFLITGMYYASMSILKISVALCLMSLAALFRLQLNSLLTDLRDQIYIAKSFGAGSILIFTKIIFPQILESTAWLSAIASFWACGDFAISRIISGKNISLAMMVDNYLSGYHISEATSLSFIVLLTGSCCYLFIKYLIIIFSKKIVSWS